jgi:hypothetical protein
MARQQPSSSSISLLPSHESLEDTPIRGIFRETQSNAGEENGMTGSSGINPSMGGNSDGENQTVPYETRPHIRGAAIWQGGEMIAVGCMPLLEHLVEILNSEANSISG